MLASIKVVGFLGVVLLGAAATIACSSSSGGSSGDNSSGSMPTPEGGSDSSTPDTSVADSAPEVVNACKNFVDRSAASASRTIDWTFSVSTAPERCMIIKKGQDVTFMGDFTLHPLLAEGGDKPNPISMPDGTGKVTFAKAGLFGFQCGNHPSMTGAIQVTE